MADRPTFEELFDNFKRTLMNVSPWISYASETAKWATIRQTIHHATSLNLSQNVTREVYRQAGFRFGDAMFNDVFKQQKESPYILGRVRYTTRESHVSENSMDIGIYQMHTKYKYVGEYKEYDFTTGNIKTKRFSIDSNQLKTRAEIEEQLEEEISSFYGKELTQVSDINLRYAYINPLHVQ